MTDYRTDQNDATVTHVERAAHPPLTRVDLTGEAATVTQAYKNWVVVDVNDHCVRLAVMVGEYRWHQHPRSDECFLVLEGRLEIDLTDGRTIGLGPGEMFTVPAGVRHRTRSSEPSVNVCFERANAYTDVVFDDDGRASA